MSRDGLARSLRLARAFTLEQRRPDAFYRVLAADSVAQVSRYLDLRGARVLDVGGGPGWFDGAFVGAGARYCAVELDPAEAAARMGGPEALTATVVADGAALPFADATFDLCFSSNVLEHVPDPWRMGDEMVRVTRPGGLVFLSFNNWLAPNGGHETAPWHYLGGDRARVRFEERNGRPPKNYYGRSLFPVSIGSALAWAKRHPRAALVEAVPRYHPRWARGVVRLPGVREIATWNLLLILRRR
jgi:SAM-dependent methyltransferase